MRKSLLRCVTPLMALALVLSACGRTPAKTLAERYADGELLYVDIGCPADFAISPENRLGLESAVKTRLGYPENLLFRYAEIGGELPGDWACNGPEVLLGMQPGEQALDLGDPAQLALAADRIAEELARALGIEAAKAAATSPISRNATAPQSQQATATTIPATTTTSTTKQTTTTKTTTEKYTPPKTLKLSDIESNTIEKLDINNGISTDWINAETPKTLRYNNNEGDWIILRNSCPRDKHTQTGLDLYIYLDRENDGTYDFIQHIQEAPKSDVTFGVDLSLDAGNIEIVTNPSGVSAIKSNNALCFDVRPPSYSDYIMDVTLRDNRNGRSCNISINSGRSIYKFDGSSFVLASAKTI